MLNHHLENAVYRSSQAAERDWKTLRKSDWHYVVLPERANTGKVSGVVCTNALLTTLVNGRAISKSRLRSAFLMAEFCHQ